MKDTAAVLTNNLYYHQKDGCEHGDPGVAGCGKICYNCVERTLKDLLMEIDLQAETVQAYRSAQIDALNALALNLAMVVRRLVRKMHKTAPTDPIIQQAMDFLVTNGLQGSVLRAEARESERCAKGYCQYKRSDHNDGFEGCTFRGDDQDGHCVCSAFSEEMNLCPFCLADVRDCTCKL